MWMMALSTVLIKPWFPLRSRTRKPMISESYPLSVCVQCCNSVSIPQWSTTGSSPRTDVTTRSSSSTSLRSQRARPSLQQSFVSLRNVWAAPSATTPSYSKSTRWSRSTLTGNHTNKLLHKDSWLRTSVVACSLGRLVFVCPTQSDCFAVNKQKTVV